MRDNLPKEYCGLFGVHGHPNAAPTIYRGLFSLQHRGQEGAGIATSNGTQIKCVKNCGLINEVFSARSWNELPGQHGIGHVRYSTTGANRLANVQPIMAECMDGIWAIAHNGNLVNAATLRRAYQNAGAIFQTSTDSEILVHLLADPLFRTHPQRVALALSQLEGAFAFLLMTRDCLMATRDRLGFRPLSIGQLHGATVFASETCALAQTGATYLRDVLPGELVVVDERGMRSCMFAKPAEPRLAQCVFELVYFARPDSTVFGENAHKIRLQYGQLLAREHPVAADIVVAIPDSGNSAALGFAQASGIPLDFGFIRNHYVGRTFIMPNASDRAVSADLKLSALPEVVRDKRIVVVDDSIVRGTTSRRRIAMLREAGAREVHMRISCPPVSHPCYFGIDFPSRDELIAGSQNIAQTRAYIGADTLGYLSLEGLLAPLKQPHAFCRACFDGQYPLNVSQGHDKQALEIINTELPMDGIT